MSRVQLVKVYGYLVISPVTEAKATPGEAEVRG